MFKLCVFFICVSLTYSETLKYVSEEDYFGSTSEIQQQGGMVDGSGFSATDSSGLFGDENWVEEQRLEIVTTTNQTSTTSTTDRSTTTVTTMSTMSFTTPAPQTTGKPLDEQSKTIFFFV